MDIAQRLFGAVPVIRVSGDLDRPNAPALDQVFQAHVSGGQHCIILDLSDCPYVDSGGLATLMTTVGELRDDGLLAIIAPSPSIRRLLEVVGLCGHRSCAIFKAEQEALSALAPTSLETGGRQA